MISAGLCIHSRSRIIRIISGIIMCLNTIVLNLNYTFGAWFGIIFAWILLFVIDCVCKRNRKQTVIVFAVFLTATAVSCLITPNLINSIRQFFTDDVHGVVIDENISTGSSRWQMWKVALQCIREKPIFGWGNEGIDDIIFETIGQTRPHNEYLQYAAFYGIPTGICYFAGCLFVFLRALKERSSLSGTRIVCLTAAFAYLVSAFFGNTMFYTTPFLFILLGLSWKDNNNSIRTCPSACHHHQK
ncbi:MAG: O-antigen ligase family protein [Clostridiales bacterium]|nr:O-antigen ligase family protein [Clostridiales bacterium]